MKKLISLLLVIALCVGAVCVLTACEKEAAPIEEPVLAGGWQISGEDMKAEMPQEAKEAFDKAMEARKDVLDGDVYTPLAYLGSQVVAGTNYAYLCRTGVTDYTRYANLCVVTIYCGTTGEASVTDVSYVRIPDYTEDAALSFDAEPVAGGWTLCADYPAKLGESDQASFDAATAELLGVDYTPLALMGSQVVAGMNLAFLCCATSVTAEPASALAVVIVYAALDGTSTVTSIAPFSIA